jgi:hypothetical protein
MRRAADLSASIKRLSAVSDHGGPIDEKIAIASKGRTLLANRRRNQFSPGSEQSSNRASRNAVSSSKFPVEHTTRKLISAVTRCQLRQTKRRSEIAQGANHWRRFGALSDRRSRTVVSDSSRPRGDPESKADSVLKGVTWLKCFLSAAQQNRSIGRKRSSKMALATLTR